MVDLSKIEEGDHLLVLCVFHGRANGGFWVNAPGAHPSNSMSIDPSSVVEHRPRPIAVGDSVRRSGAFSAPATGEVVALHGTAAWVVWPIDEIGGLHHIDELERISND